MTDAVTPAAHRSLVPRDLTVVTVTQLSTSYRRVRFVAPSLAGAPSELGSDISDAITIELLFPNSDPAAPAFERPFTLLNIDPTNGEFDVDFVLHDHTGVAVDWVKRARAGDALGMFGPRGAGMLPEEAERLVLIGDATAVPTIRALVKAAGPHVCADVVLKVPTYGDVLALTSGAALNTQWLVSDANDPRQLLAAVRALPVETSDVDFWWVACEKRSATDIGTHLREARAVEPGRLEVVPYWKAGSDEDAFHDERHRLTDETRR